MSCLFHVMPAEMARAGLIDEVMNDAIDSALGDEDLEEETDAEVQKVLQEVAGDVIAALPAAAKPTKVGGGGAGVLPDSMDARFEGV